VLPKRIGMWSLTSLQQRLVKTGGRVGKACSLLLAIVGGEPPDGAPVWKHGAANRSIAAGGRIGAAVRRYAALAKQRSWPSPVAVDELTTEPSLAEAQSVLGPLAETIETPIVEDTSGRLADTYHVDDLPWFVLNSVSGKILWSHDGWLSAAALKQQVDAALAGS